MFSLLDAPSKKIIPTEPDFKPMLDNFIRTNNFECTADEVIEKLLSPNDIKDILSGDISAKCLIAHIKLWIDEGKND